MEKRRGISHHRSWNSPFSEPLSCRFGDLSWIHTGNEHIHPPTCVSGQAFFVFPTSQSHFLRISCWRKVDEVRQSGDASWVTRPVSYERPWVVFEPLITHCQRLKCNFCWNAYSFCLGNSQWGHLRQKCLLLLAVIFFHSPNNSFFMKPLNNFWSLLLNFGLELTF